MSVAARVVLDFISFQIDDMSVINEMAICRPLGGIVGNKKCANTQYVLWAAFDYYLV